MISKTLAAAIDEVTFTNDGRQNNEKSFYSFPTKIGEELKKI